MFFAPIFGRRRRHRFLLQTSPGPNSGRDAASPKPPDILYRIATSAGKSWDKSKSDHFYFCHFHFSLWGYTRFHWRHESVFFPLAMLKVFFPTDNVESIFSLATWKVSLFTGNLKVFFIGNVENIIFSQAMLKVFFSCWKGGKYRPLSLASLSAINL